MLKALMTEFFSYGVSVPTLSKEVFELWNKKKTHHFTSVEKNVIYGKSRDPLIGRLILRFQSF